MKNRFLLYIAFVFGALNAHAQEFAPGITYDNLIIEHNKTTGEVDVSFRLKINRKAVKSDYVMIITPLLKGERTVELPHVAIQGKQFRIAEQRRLLSGFPAVSPSGSIELNNGDRYNYSASVPYIEWMNNISFLSQAVSYGCCDESAPDLNTLVQNLSLIPLVPVRPVQPVQPVQPVKSAQSYTTRLITSFIMPKVETLKTRSEAGSAYLDFEVGRSEIKPDFKNNTFELRKIYTMIEELQKDSYATITGITIKGYASPEGTYVSNLSLSERRAVALKQHIKTLYGFEDRLFYVKGEGEDWGTLDSLVVQSNMPGKYQILEIIRSVGVFDGREKRLMDLSAGYPYRQMKAEMFPMLRRSDYQLHYTVIPFTVETGKEIFKTKPSNLSLNEMFLIAQEYEAGTDEFNELFETAARLFPLNDVANLNAAASVLSRGDTAAASRYLARVADKNSSTYYNNMGVLNFIQGSRDNALQYFEKAKAAGDEQAMHNVSELNRQ